MIEYKVLIYNFTSHTYFFLIWLELHKQILEKKSINYFHSNCILLRIFACLFGCAEKLTTIIKNGIFCTLCIITEYIQLLNLYRLPVFATKQLYHNNDVTITNKYIVFLRGIVYLFLKGKCLLYLGIS